MIGNMHETARALGFSSAPSNPVRGTFFKKMRAVTARVLAVLGAWAAPALCAHAAETIKTTLYSFPGGADGGIPEAGLTADTDGALYGVSNGGPMGSGLVYKLTPPAAGSTQWTKTTLYAFNGGSDGGFPQAGLVFDSDGALYGATREGGANYAGAIFKLSRPAVAGGAWTKTTLYSFKGGADGAQPLSGPILDNEGALYGTANQQGAGGAGAVYKLTPPAPGSTVWTKTTLYDFKGGSDGSNPYSGVAFDTAGALYGTTAFGGLQGAGTVYRLAQPLTGSTVWSKSTLYAFTGDLDGNFPRATVTFGTDGAIYGVTYGGGASSAGTVYKLTAPAAGATLWTKTMLYNFTGGADGARPFSEVTFDTTGALYGATFQGGASSSGVVFKLTPPAAGSTQWTESVFYSFGGGSDGASPGGLVFDNKGSIYGVTVYGGAGYNGSVFQFSLPAPARPAKALTEALLYNFGGADGAAPKYGQPIIDTRGAIFLTTRTGGASDMGAVVRLNPPTVKTPKWTSTLLYSFTGKDGGANPTAGLTFDTEGDLYGTASAGGASGAGVVFRLSRPDTESGKWTLKVLKSFTGDSDGRTPNGGALTLDSKGAFYGVTQLGGANGNGVVYRVKPLGESGKVRYDVLYNFDGSFGGYSDSGVIFDTDGDLYGTIFMGASGYGAVYRLSPAGHSVGSAKWTQSLIYSFKSYKDGFTPRGSLVFDNHGSLYGVTSGGGEFYKGSVFKLSPPASGAAWRKTTLYSFQGASDGDAPASGVIFDTTGAIYGAATRGGSMEYGAVFKLTPPASGTAWTKSVLRDFKGLDGAEPSALVFDTKGALFGASVSGGAYNKGMAFQLK